MNRKINVINDIPNKVKIGVLLYFGTDSKKQCFGGTI